MTGTVQDIPVTLHDHWLPTLKAGSYSVAVTHEMAGEKEVKETFTAPARTFEVVAPRFTLDPALVHSAFPVPGSSGDFSLVLPHISLTGATLPWDRPPSTSAEKSAPWLALLVLTAAELPADPATGETGQERPVAEMTPENKTDVPAGVLLPKLCREAVTVGPDRCRTIDVDAKVFTAVVPRLSELRYLAHVRRPVPPAVNTRPRDDDVSVVVANRLPRTPGTYSAHLVSLEGLGDWLAKLPDKDTREKGPVKVVRLVSLRSWTFEVLPKTRPSFTTVAEHLRDNSGKTPLLRLDGPWNAGGHSGLWRLRHGYVPLRHRLPTGERTYAWYRGPFTPVRAAPLPGGAAALTSEAAALIHLPRHNMFDVSYASAFALGKELALAYADLPATLAQLGTLGLETIARYAGEYGATEPRATQAADPTVQAAPADPSADGDGEGDLLLGLRLEGTAREAFEASLADEPEEGDEAAAVGGVRAGATDSDTDAEASGPPLDPSAYLHAALEPAAGSAVDTAHEQAVTVALTALDQAGISPDKLLAAVPFAHLVPDARLLPPETVRFFHVDEQWVNAVSAGVLSLGIRTTLEKSLIERLLHKLIAFKQLPVAGMLVRSTLVRDWPGLIFTAHAGTDDVLFGQPRVLAPDLALVFFSAVPDTVTLRQPAQALHFGLDGERYLLLRYLQKDKTGQDKVGQSMGDAYRLDLKDSHLRTPPPTLPKEVLDIGAFVTALRDKLASVSPSQWKDTVPLTPVAAMLQLVNTPGELVFRPAASGLQHKEEGR